MDDSTLVLLVADPDLIHGETVSRWILDRGHVLNAIPASFRAFSESPALQASASVRAGVKRPEVFKSLGQCHT